MKVLGFDPSLSNWGIVVANLDLESLDFEIEKMLLVETKPGKNKRVRKNSDDLERAQAICDAISEQLEDVSMVFVEVPHGSQSARAMASYGICIGILSAIDIPMIQLTERELKQATVGKNTASKTEMIEWAVEKYPEAKWLKRGNSFVAKNEHLADATGAIYAGVRSDEFANVLAALRYIKKAS